MISHGSQIITDLRRGTWRITRMTRGTFDILGTFTTPYNFRATAALQAAFSTTQWETIAEYGRTTPYLAAINAFAPEDPYIMYSLIPELGVVRGLISDAVAYINTEVNPTQYENLSFDCVANIIGANTYAHALFGVIGNVNAGSGMYGIIFHGTGGIAYRCGTFNSNYISIGKSSPTGIIRIKGTKTNTTMELWVDGVSKGTKSVGVPASKTIYLYRTNYSNASVERIPTPSMIANLSFKAGDNEIKNFIPCKHNEQNGMLDLVGATWYGNANSSGSFTISETPAA